MAKAKKQGASKQAKVALVGKQDRPATAGGGKASTPRAGASPDDFAAQVEQFVAMAVDALKAGGSKKEGQVSAQNLVKVGGKVIRDGKKLAEAGKRLADKQTDDDKKEADKKTQKDGKDERDKRRDDNKAAKDNDGRTARAASDGVVEDLAPEVKQMRKKKAD